MTRPGRNPRKGAGNSSSGSTPGRAGSLGRSSLWSDDEPAARSAPRPAARNRDEYHRNEPPRDRSAPPERRRSAIGSFVRRHGWRAYAIPVLIAVTVLILLQVGRTSTAAPVGSGPSVGATTTDKAATDRATTAGAIAPQGRSTTAAPASRPAAAAAAAASSSGPTTSSSTADPSPTSPSGLALPAAPPPTTTIATDPTSAAGVGAGVAAAAALPAGQSFVARGKGTWHVVKGTSPVMGSGPTKYTYSIEVEDGIENAAADRDFAALVDAALADRRSWIGSGQVQLQRVDTGTPSFRISLTSQLSVRENSLCGWEIHYEASCYARDVRRVAINNARWARGAVSFDGDRAAYRVYAINHEVGHALGNSHRPCPVAGGPAPVMMQQSWSTADNDLAPLNPQLIPMDGKICKFNPYPFPADAGAPGVVSAGG